MEILGCPGIVEGRVTWAMMKRDEEEEHVVGRMSGLFWKVRLGLAASLTNREEFKVIDNNGLRTQVRGVCNWLMGARSSLP